MSAHSRSAELAAADVIAELKQVILEQFPNAAFRTRVAPDGRIFLDASTDADNDFDVLNLVAEQTVDFMIAHHRSVHVFPRCRA